MSDHTAQSVIRNILHGLSTWVLPLVLGLFVTRVVVHSLGHHDYGIYALVLGIIAYSFNFSIGRAITKYIAEYRETDDNALISDVVTATFALIVSVAIAGSTIMFLAADWLAGEVFAVEDASRPNATLAIRIGSAIIAVLMLGQVPASVLQGLHRFDTYSRVQNVNSIVMLLGNLVLAYNGFGLIALLWWNLAASVIVLGVGCVLAKRQFPELRISLQLKWPVFKLVAAYSLSVIGYQILTNIYFIFERSWVVSRKGPEELTFYVVPMTIGIYLHGFVLSLCMVLLPLASGIEKDKARLLRLYQYATKAVLALVVCITGTLIVTGRVFLTLWMGPQFGERSYELLVIHAVAFSLAAIVIVSFQVAEGTGRPGFNFLNMLIGVTIAIPAIILLTSSLGTVGVGLGRVLVFGISVIAIFVLERRIFSNFLHRFWIKGALRLAAAVAGLALVQSLLLNALGLGWLTLGLAAAAGTTIFAGILLITGFLNKSDWQLLKRLGPKIN